MLAFPTIDPVALEIGPLAIRWYALAYVAGIVLGYRYVVKLAERHGPAFTSDAKDNLIPYAILGVLFGGRLGYVLFYQPAYFIEHPQHILMLWQGGMSFHGGAAGVIIAYALFARKYRLSYLSLMDKIVCAVPIGLFLGRIANFINGELYGRHSDVPWAMAFPRGGPDPRHPSQLYEAALEGLALFVLLYVLQRYTKSMQRHGLLGGVFLVGYGLSRITAECFREP
ncbi:MAG: prolipoprotein diacylglyceryl transferase, partial [Alphaproteobacteria bacterium]|nr:prolipoprotein diacylglyceryl transferase [Alphaproteobacteria bacterium]